MPQEQEDAPHLPEDQVLHVPGAAGHRLHAPQGHLPSRYQARKHTRQGQSRQVGRSRLMQGQTFARALYRLYLHTVVQGARVFDDRRLL